MEILQALPKDLANIVNSYSDNEDDKLYTKMLKINWIVKRQICSKICYKTEIWNFEKLIKEIKIYQNQIPFIKKDRDADRTSGKHHIKDTLNDFNQAIINKQEYAFYYAISNLNFSYGNYDKSTIKQQAKVKNLKLQCFNFIKRYIKLTEYINHSKIKNCHCKNRECYICNGGDMDESMYYRHYDDSYGFFNGLYKFFDNL
jgi:hypothetical protein